MSLVKGAVDAYVDAQQAFAKATTVATLVEAAEMGVNAYFADLGRRLAGLSPEEVQIAYAKADRSQHLMHAGALRHYLRALLAEGMRRSGSQTVNEQLDGAAAIGVRAP